METLGIQAQSGIPSGSASIPSQGIQLTPEKVLAATAMNPQLGSALGGIYSGQQRQQAGIEKEYLKSNLGTFKEAQQKLPELKNNDLRLGRLEELSQSGELPGPLFSKINMTKEGTVRFPSLFSKEGQEFTKLIVDSAKGAKDTFGGRITNFELNTFLQSLPSLLQSPEGRDAVIRDLKIMNEITRLHNQAVLDISKETGLKADPAQFESLVQEKIGPQVEELSKQFVRPESAAPSQGLTIEVMQEFLKKAPGKTKEQKIANAKKLAKQKGYDIE